VFGPTLARPGADDLLPTRPKGRLQPSPIQAALPDGDAAARTAIERACAATETMSRKTGRPGRRERRHDHEYNSYMK